MSFRLFKLLVNEENLVAAVPIGQVETGLPPAAHHLPLRVPGPAQQSARTGGQAARPSRGQVEWQQSAKPRDQRRPATGNREAG